METRKVRLADGNILEIDVKPGFYDAVRKQFMLLPTDAVTDDHLRMFIYGAVKGAVDNLGKEEAK